MQWVAARLTVFDEKHKHFLDVGHKFYAILRGTPKYRIQSTTVPIAEHKTGLNKTIAACVHVLTTYKALVMMLTADQGGPRLHRWLIAYMLLLPCNMGGLIPCPRGNTELCAHHMRTACCPELLRGMLNKLS